MRRRMSGCGWTERPLKTCTPHCTNLGNTWRAAHRIVPGRCSRRLGGLLKVFRPQVVDDLAVLRSRAAERQRHAGKRTLPTSRRSMQGKQQREHGCPSGRVALAWNFIAPETMAAMALAATTRHASSGERPSMASPTPAGRVRGRPRSIWLSLATLLR